MSFDPVSYLLGKQAGGGGGGVTVEPLSVSENGTYTAPSGKAYSPVTVDVSRDITIEFIVNTLAMSARTFIPAINKLTLHNIYAGTGKISMGNACAQLGGVSILEVVVDEPPISLRSAFDSINIPSVILDIDYSSCTEFTKTFSGNNIEGLEIVVTGAPLDLSAVTKSDNLTDLIGQNVKEIRFVPSSCKVSWKLPAPVKASDDTLISIANALDGTATGQTLTLYAPKKARCGEIVGTVTGGIFSIDAQGSMTLTEFITTVKGWTLA